MQRGAASQMRQALWGCVCVCVCVCVCRDESGGAGRGGSYDQRPTPTSLSVPTTTATTTLTLAAALPPLAPCLLTAMTSRVASSAGVSEERVVHTTT